MISAVPGDVYCWGTGRGGELGSPPDREGVIPFPTKVKGIKHAIQVECGDCFTVALTSNGQLHSWGSNRGKLGRSGEGMTPGLVEGLEGCAVSHLAVGQYHALCVVDGTVFGWGKGSKGCLGTGMVSSIAENPKPILGADGNPLSGVVKVFAGYQSSACITASGLLLTTGYGGAGNLGHGTRKSLSSFTVVEALKGVPMQHVAVTVGQINPVTQGNVSGTEQPHTLAVSKKGQLFSWGTCHKGMLGNHSKKILSPHSGDELTPYLVGSPTRDDPAVSGYLDGQSVVGSAASSIHSTVVTAAGDCYSFGCGSGGRMGIKKYMEGLHGGRSRMKCYVSVPTPIEYLAEHGLKAQTISASRHHMAAVVVEGSGPRVPRFYGPLTGEGKKDGEEHQKSESEESDEHDGSPCCEE